MDPRPGDEGRPAVAIGGYEEMTEVGRGGFAVVYRARQPSFDRQVAIKLMSGDLDTTVMSRFQRECLAIGALSDHPNIVTVYELGWTPDGKPYIVMEFLAGGSLGDRLDQMGRFDWQRAVEMTIKVAGALESAHRAGVLHRDVKPENVLLSRYGEVKLGDFGIARITGRTETQTSGVTASWAHAPPEVINGKRPNIASDLYSLTSMLFTLVTGRAPFSHPGDEGLLPLLNRILVEPVPDLRPSGVPDALCRVIEQGMAKDPAERPASAAELGRLLQQVQVSAGIPTTEVPLEIVDVARKTGVTLPSLSWSGSGDLDSLDRPSPLAAAAAATSAPIAAGAPTPTPGAARAAPIPAPAAPISPPPPEPAASAPAPPVPASVPRDSPPPAPLPPPASAPPPPVAAATSRRRSRLPVLVALLAAAAIAVVVVVLMADRPPSDDDDAASSDETTEESGPEVLIDTTFPVLATQIWTDTGVDLEKGQQVTITASGEVEAAAGLTNGPEGVPELRIDSNLIDTADHNALVARIGEFGEPFYVGPEADFEAAEDGRLYLGVNDDGVDNNTGEYTIDLRVVDPG